MARGGGGVEVPGQIHGVLADAGTSYPVEVQSDFLERITRAQPLHALAEFIWTHTPLTTCQRSPPRRLLRAALLGLEWLRASRR